jgi:hypothetical protein
LNWKFKESALTFTLGDKEISGLHDYDFCYSAELFVSLLQSRKEETVEWHLILKIVIMSNKTDTDRRGEQS